MRTSRRRTLTWIAVAATGVACLVAAVVLARGHSARPPAALGTVPPVSPARTVSAAPTSHPAPTSPRARATAGPPSRVQIPRLDIDGRVVPVTVDAAGELGVPSDPRVLGWWREGARLGDTGSVVIDGHVDSARAGLGTFFQLGRAEVGDTIWVTGATGRVRYTVRARRSYQKAGSGIPPATFSTTGRPRLVLITCGGRFDRASRNYADNIVVYAVPGR